MARELHLCQIVNKEIYLSEDRLQALVDHSVVVTQQQQQQLLLLLHMLLMLLMLMMIITRATESPELHWGNSGPKVDSRSAWLQQFRVDFLVQRYICDKIFTKIRSVFPEITAKILAKCPTPQGWKILLKIPRYRSVCGRLPKSGLLLSKDTLYISGKIFTKIR